MILRLKENSWHESLSRKTISRTVAPKVPRRPWPIPRAWWRSKSSDAIANFIVKNLTGDTHVSIRNFRELSNWQKVRNRNYLVNIRWSNIIWIGFCICAVGFGAINCSDGGGNTYRSGGNMCVKGRQRKASQVVPTRSQTGPLKRWVCASAILGPLERDDYWVPAFLSLVKFAL